MESYIKFSSGTLSESRRKFIEKAGVSLVLGTLGASFFTSCSTTEDANPSPPVGGGGVGGGTSSGIVISGNTITIDLTIRTALNNNGSWLLIENAKTLVAKVGGNFVALTSVCTHEGCDKDWTFSSNIFTCTCHGSRFDPSGKVLQGPAQQPLTAFAAVVAGTTLTITK
jgi:cytochrome b6-f complex iron-sulfur subunit